MDELTRSVEHIQPAHDANTLMYIHLTTHSAYSLQEALPLPDELARAARADGMPASPTPTTGRRPSWGCW